MSELKAFDVGLGQYCEDGSPCVVAFDADRNPRLLNEKVYLKSEADKEIDFWKKASHDHYERWFRLNKQYEGWFGKVMRCERAERELRNQKYKRCLAMARWCAAERDIYNLTPKFAKMNFYKKWRKRWLKLAEKFKEAK